MTTETVKVFASYGRAIEWLSRNDPESAAVEYPIQEAEQAPSIVPKRTDVQELVDAFLEGRAV
ncbi:hypothetical protein [Bradyrhizobium yuanmingense]|uniref:hypothetical protein n=1 Tax=Bradyrhizobium yuanmingense TaxID=108015 RepID=UPI0007C8758D|nr:hypothetical protein [Bradyrhizobium yuanmingense]